MRYVFAAAAAILLGFAATVVTLSESALRIPARLRQVSDPPGASEVSVRSTDGTLLRGALFRPRAPVGKAVLVLHGLGDTRRGAAAFAPMLTERGFTVLVPDSRGHGASGGDLVTYGIREKDDVRAWVSTLPEGRVYGLGESMGAAILIQALEAEPRLRSVVAECSYATFRDAALDRIPRLAPWAAFARVPILEAAFWYIFWRYGLDLDMASPAAALARSRTPVLLIHGLADDRTAPEQSRRLHAAAPHTTELWEVPGAGHTRAFAAAGDEFQRRVLEWFEK